MSSLLEGSMKAMTPKNLYRMFFRGVCENPAQKFIGFFLPVSNRRTQELLERSLVVPSPELHQPEQNGDNKIILKTEMRFGRYLHSHEVYRKDN